MNSLSANRVYKAISGLAAGVFAVSFLAFPANADSYSGITIDGDFSDWDSVVKYDVELTDTCRVNQVAMVWDGDWIYIYMDEAMSHSASWSSSNTAGTNGQYCITTDGNNETLVIYVTDNGANGNKIEVTDINTNTVLNNENGGLQVAFNSEYLTWGEPSLTEIAIPASALPDYISTLSFGFYLGDTLISDVADCSGMSHDDPDDPTPTPYNDGSGIEIDGDYEDWRYYPRTIIEYDTSGTHFSHHDADGSIMSRDGKAYLYCCTNYFEDEDTGYAFGAELTEVTVWVNGAYTQIRGIELSPDGSLDWDAYKQRELSPGTHHFALFYYGDAQASSNVNNVQPGDTYLGDMYITVGEYQDETEFWFDIATLAERAGVTPSEAMTIDVQFHRVGKKLLSASGVSTGPVIVIALSAVAAGSYFTYSRRKKAE